MQEVLPPQADVAVHGSPLSFPVVDPVVRHNLQRLDHLSRQTCRDGSLSMLGIPSHLVIEAVASGQADIGYAEGSGERVGFSIDAVRTVTVVALPNGHPLTEQQLNTSQDLAQERFISLGRGTIFASRVDVALADVQRMVVAETWLSHTACIMVFEGVGITLVDVATASEFVGRVLTIRPFSLEVDDMSTAEQNQASGAA